MVCTTLYRSFRIPEFQSLVCQAPEADILGSRFASIKRHMSNRFYGPCLYYANFIEQKQIALLCSGDIEQTSGPKCSSKCSACDKTLRKNQNNIEFTACFGGVSS